MLRFVPLFLCGTLAFHQLAWLPGWRWCLAGALLTLFLSPVRRLRPWLAPLLGFVWSHGYALATAPPDLAADNGVVRLVIDARIVSLLGRSGQLTRFLVETDDLPGQVLASQGPWRFRLTWRMPPEIAPGQAWRLPVRLRAVHGYASPGAWDQEGWLYWQGVRYSGYVDPNLPAQRLAQAACCWLTRVRARLADRLDALPISGFARGVLRALVIGDAAGMSPDASVLFRATGTSHLMAISGLHIGLVAAIGLVGVSAIWRRVPGLCARIPARVAGAMVGLLGAVVYAALAGLSLPTQRALVMLSLLALGLIWRRETSVPHTLALAAFGVLLWHPPSVVAAGFWLSFGAVLAILLALRSAAQEPRWLSAIRLQLAISLALWPVLTVFEMPASWLAPLVNLLLVPLFGLLIVPLSLLAIMLLLASPEVAGPLFRLLGELLDLVEIGLAWMAALGGPIEGRAQLPAIGTVALALAALLLLAPAGFPLRRFGLGLILVPWLPRADHLPHGAFELHLLDVGQGLSAVVETRRHTLVFDTGPEFASGFSTARVVLVPFLRSRGRMRVDSLVVSHGDTDHAGGLAFLADALPLGDALSGEPTRVGHGARPCVAGERWEWDGVLFEFLHPPARAALRGNNASCVLRVGNGVGSALLTGDIEALVEQRLVATVPRELRSSVVIAPHHGSRSSSSRPFVAATRADYVVFTAGWANRYGFPAPEVEARWRDAGTVPLDTATLGTISFVFPDSGSLLVPRAFRSEARRFWWHDSGSAARSHAVSSADRPGRE